MVASLGRGLARGLIRSAGTKAGKGASTAVAAKAAAKAKAIESVRQGSIIKAQQAKESVAKTQGFKKALAEAKSNKQKSFTYDGKRFIVANYV